MTKRFLPVLSILVLFYATAAQAAEPKVIGTYGDWTAFTFTEGGKKICYMASTPKKAQGNYTKRGEDIFALITHRPAEGSKDVFSYVTGYTYKANSEVTITIGSKTFRLFTQGDTAWTPDSETDKNLAQAIRGGSNMVVKGRSSRGTLTTDTYSLKGSGSAHDAINKACGV